MWMDSLWFSWADGERLHKKVKTPAIADRPLVGQFRRHGVSRRLAEAIERVSCLRSQYVLTN